MAKRSISIEEIQERIKSLTLPRLQELSDWFDAYKAEMWDQQIASDARAGKLDRLLEEAKLEAERGDFDPL